MEYLNVLNNKKDYSNRYDRLRQKFDIADRYKAWDMDLVLSAFEDLKINTNVKVIDFGAYNDATLWALHDIGYKELYGVDLNHDIYGCKYYTQIKYKYANIEDTHFPTSFFNVGICLSVIEHKVDIRKFFTEAKRVLKDGSYLFITTDFSLKKLYPQNGDKIFSYNEIYEIVKIAKRVGFTPLFNKASFQKITKSENPVYFNGLQYTFVFLGFKLNKNNLKFPENPINKISIISYSLGSNGGISKYAKLLTSRLDGEKGVTANLYNNVKTAAKSYAKDVLIEYHPSLRTGADLVKDIKYLKRNKKNVYVEIHEHIGILSSEQRRVLGRDAIMLYRANEFAEHDKITNYLLVPQMSYTNIPINDKAPKDILVGTFGYAIKEKRINELVALLTRLNVKGLFILGLNLEIKDADNTMKREIERIKRIADRNDDVAVINKEEAYPKDKKIVIELGDFSDNENAQELEKCSHFIFAQRQAFAPSGSMVYVKRFIGRPIISLNNYQSKFSGVVRVEVLNSRLHPLYDKTFDLIWRAITEKRMPSLREYVISVYHILKAKPMSKEFLDISRKFLPIEEDDGYEYLISILNYRGRVA